MQTLAQSMKIVSGLFPVDATGAAQTGDYVSLKNYEHFTAIVKFGALSSSDTMTVALLQAKTVAAGSAKALTFANAWLSDASGDTLTKVTVTADGDYDIASTDTLKFLVIEVRASELDVANGFDCVALTISSPGAHATLVDVTYVLSGARFGGGSGVALPSAIID